MLRPLLLFTLLSAACGEPVTYLSCDEQNVVITGTRVNQCVVFAVTPGKTNDALASCQSVGGLASSDPCRTSGALGSCRDIQMNGLKAVLWIFPSDVTQTQAAAQVACSNLQGTFTPGTSDPMPGLYHLTPNASAFIPSGQRGFAITANGQGGYRIAWSDHSTQTTTTTPRTFTGSVTTTGTFSGVQKVYGSEQITTTGGRLTFASQPLDQLHGVDLMSSVDPIVITGQIDGSAVDVRFYFSTNPTGPTSATDDPITVRSP
jgi:hypothetical protein